MSTQYVFVYVTCSTQREAIKISNKVVSHRLAACANILPNVSSVYKWKSKLQQSQEVIVIFKSKRSHYKKLKSLIEKLHSYESPCILSLAIEQGNAKYLKWIDNNLGSQK